MVLTFLIFSGNLKIMTDEDKAKRNDAMEKWKAKNPDYHKEWRRKHPGYQPNTDASITKTCPACKEQKPATLEFFSKERTRPLGLSGYCNKCLVKRKVEYAKRNREKVNSRQREWRSQGDRERIYTLRGYRLTVAQYEAMLHAQGGVCAICMEPPKKSAKGRLCVDHNHACCNRSGSCGKCVRGLLCIKCNNTLERMESIPNWYDRAMAYLVKFEIAKREEEFK